MGGEIRLSRRDLFALIGASAALKFASGCNRQRPESSAIVNTLREPIIYSSAASLAKAIRAKQISSSEVVHAHLKRIDQVNGKLNAVVQLCAERALKEAKDADEQLVRGEIKGPLHGVPMTIKDSLDTEGVISTAGTLGRKNFIPSKDATVVERLRRAGAILLGKTNTPEIADGGETYNDIFGRTNNPYDLNKSPGGSSGGAAAIVAAAGSPFDIGSDTGGSVRGPAHFCGIAGLKPSAGRVPRTGHIVSFGTGAIDSWTHLGPMARYVEDLALVLPLIIGTDWQDPSIVDVPLGDSARVDLKQLRVTFHTDNTVRSPTPEIIQAVRTAVSKLSGAVAHIDERQPANIKRAAEFTDQVALAISEAYYKRIFTAAGTAEKDYGPIVKRYRQTLQKLSPNSAGDLDNLTFLRSWSFVKAKCSRS